MSNMYGDSSLIGQKLLEAIQSGDLRVCEESITAFKQHIKRNLVDLSYIVQYLEGLIGVYAYKELSVLAFSTFCHLIKRISIQDAHALHDVYDVVVPFLLQRLGEHKESIRLTAIKSLKTCVESSPNGDIDLIIHYLIKDGVNKDQFQIQVPVLDFLYQIIESSANFNFSFKYILDNITKLLNSQDHEVLEKCSQILILYFTVMNPTNNTAKNDLLNALITQNIYPTIASKVLNAIDRNLCNRYVSQLNGSSRQNTPVQRHEQVQTVNSISEKLETLLQKVPNWNVDDVLQKSDFNTDDDPTYQSLYDDFSVQFEGKENEKNWKHRQILIIKVRQILNDESFLVNLENFVEFVKLIKEPITKGMLSLRTTLSNNACQLCKELALSVGLYLDFAFVEYQLNTLVKLTSARKIIQHQNSNVAIIALLLYTNLNTKFFHLFATTIHDKNIQPRVYTGHWIHLLLLKYFKPSDLETFHYTVEACEPTIIKGLTDPIPLVKEAMRNAFWALTELEPGYEEKIIRKLDNQTVKALERSKSSHVAVQVKRTPIKQLITENLKRESAEKSSSVLSYEPVRKIQRSESVDSRRLHTTTFTTNAIQAQKPAVRHHTVDSSANAKTLLATASGTVASEFPVEKFEKEEDFDDFTGRIKRENIIYEELSSDIISVQEAGFKKLLELDNSSITAKFHHVLNNLTVINPALFYAIFDDTNYFQKISNCISTENIVRVFCFYLIGSGKLNKIELIVSDLSLEDLCLSIINILNFAIDTSKIDNINLSIQFIKHRVKIIHCILQIFAKLVLLKKESIKSYMLSSIVECLITSFPIFEDSEDEGAKKTYTGVFQLCYVEYKDLFLGLISEINDVSVKNAICDIVGIPIDKEGNGSLPSIGSETQRFLSPIKVRQEEIDEDVDQMTKIIPRIKREDLDENPFVSDMTMLIPKRKGNGIFDFDNIELRPVDGIDMSEEEEEVEMNENMREEHDMKGEEVSVIEEGTDVSMIEKDKFEEPREEPKPVNEQETVDDVNSEQDVELQAGNISDSTPDLNTLTIEEIVIESEDASRGYLGVLKKDLLNCNSVTPIELSHLVSVEEVAYVVQHLGEYEIETVISSMMENISNDRFVEYCVCVLQLIAAAGDAKMVDVFNKKIGLRDSVFCCIQEFVNFLPIKFVLGLTEMNELTVQMQECLLQNVLVHLRNADVDVEDVFMIDRLAKRYIDVEEVYLRMTSYLICKEMYVMQKKHVKDDKGVELVDEWLIDSFSSKIATYCVKDLE